jgi:hypothetical protein
MESQVFKTYKDKVVYILSRYVEIFEASDSLASSAELKWCLHVI